jgi:hypothetical protein
MCIGAVAFLADVWDEGGTRAGRLTDGSVVSLAFLPRAAAGDTVLLHLGVPVEVLSLESNETEGVAP